MSAPPVHLWYDYVDPASYLLDGALARMATAEGWSLRRHPYEIRPPTGPPLDPSDPAWAAYRTVLEEEAERLAVPLREPALVPRTRKAHELALQAEEKGAFDALHGALFRAHFADGKDIGRVDVLVSIAVDAGLDRSETRAALDVDRHREAVLEARRDAERQGIRGVPVVRRGERSLDGYVGPEELGRFLSGVRNDPPD